MDKLLNGEKTPLIQPTSEESDDTFYDSTSSYNSTLVELNDDRLPELILSTSSRRSIFKSCISQSSLIASLIDKPSTDRNTSVSFTVFNILLTLQGSAVFGIPFAVLSGGLLFIPAGVFLCWLSNITSQLLIDCLYDVSPRSKRRKRVHATLSEIVDACWGKKGSLLVNAVNIFYLTANNVVNVILVGQNAYTALRGYVPLNSGQLMIAFSPLFLPLLFIKRLSVLAYASAVGVFAVIIASITATTVFLVECSQWKFNAHEIPLFDIAGFPLALGIMMFSLIINSILPEVEASMKQPQKSDKALYISYGVSTVLKFTFGVLGALTFGKSTRQIVSLNIANISSPANYIITICLIAYALTNFPLMFFVLFEQLDAAIDSYHGKELNGALYILWALLTRCFIVAVCVIAALYVPYFALLMGVVGALIGTCWIFLFPITCHLRLKWNKITKLQKSMEITLLIIGLTVGGSAIYSSVRALFSACITAP